MMVNAANTSIQRKYKMPAMVRIPNKATKIAYKIMGVPANIAFKRSAAERKINRRLFFEESQRVR